MTHHFDATEDFLLHYRAAAYANLTREQLSDILDIKPKSLLKRKSELKRLTGFSLPELRSDRESVVTKQVHDKFSKTLSEMKDKYFPEKQNDSSAKDRRYVITSAQNATPIHQEFFASLLNYCEHNNAKLIVIPFRYKNPTSIWTIETKDDWWDKSLEKYLVDKDTILSDKLRVLGNLKIQPTAEQPLSGFDSYTGVDSGIIGHPKIQLKSIATPSQILPKILMTTGAVTKKNYTESKAGFKGEFHHSFAAVVAEVEGENGIFHLRHVHGDSKTGAFYDLNYFYTPKSVQRIKTIPAVVTGDTHAEFVDEDVVKATYTNSDSIMNVLNPKYMIFHDIFDFYRRNHHSLNNQLLGVGKQHLGRNNVEEGLQKAADFIDAVSRKGTTNIIVKSNHDERFDKWLMNSEPKIDPENARFYYYMKYNQMKSITMTPTGFSSIDPFEFWCSNPDQEGGLKSIDNTKFLKRDESFTINDIEIGFHGDVGINGARGSAKSFSKIGEKCIIGHSHSPAIYESCYQVGVSAKLDLEYKSGCSSWMHTHCIIYPDGKRTLIHVINGKWRLTS